MAVKKDSVSKKNKATVKIECRKYIYIGPSIKGDALQNNTVFIGKRADVLKSLNKVIEKIPQVANLIIPIDKVSEYRLKLSQKDNIISRYYDYIIKNSK